MKSNKEIRTYANFYIKEFGLENAKRKLSQAIHVQSEEDYAIGSLNQIYFIIRVLNYIKQTY